MYVYNDIDAHIVHQRTQQFSEQLERYLNGQLSEDRFKTLRLQNGLYLQRHAPMLRVSIPYGTLHSRQLQQLAFIADNYDKGYGHFTTRQNIQFNWPQLTQVPEILLQLAKVEMHAIQTSGNCIRNITSDPLAGCVPNEAIDPRVIGEIIRQWATLHPEFAYLPRKFKIAVIATKEDRAAIEIHDIGIRIHKASDAPFDLCFDLWVGGGLGRTPHIGHCLFTQLPISELCNYLQATVRVYNLEGRRDNKYKARIKILVNAMGAERFRERVLDVWHRERDDTLCVHTKQIQHFHAFFKTNLTPVIHANESASVHPNYAQWKKTNVGLHTHRDYSVVHISLKRPGIANGDLSSTLMRVIADAADQFSRSEIRVTHDQNLVLPYVPITHLPRVYQALEPHGLTHPNKGLVTDAIACPGLDFCSLANAPTIDLATQLHDVFPNAQEQDTIGPLSIKMSGCMNACAHHHLGDIGLLGVDKKGEHWYQVTLGGRDGSGALLGEKIGPSIPKHSVGGVIRTIVDCYLAVRSGKETFAQTLQRTGIAPFKEAVYAMDLS